MNLEIVSSEMLEQGVRKLDWIFPRLRVLNMLCEEFEREKPLKGLTIGMCLHVEPKTAGLLRVLQAGGAKVAVTGSPGTTQDDVAIALANTGISVYGCSRDKRTEHLENIRDVLRHQPQLLLDNGADLTATLIEEFSANGVIGGTEETTSGAHRLRSELRGRVSFPVIVINDSPLKRIVENEHGVGQTTVEGFLRVTNLMVPGKRFVVVGYGHCGRGIAKALKHFGGRVTVVEIDPVRALEAAMLGIEVKDLEDTLTWGEAFITATGQSGVLTAKHMMKMSNGAVLANAGHFSTEFDLSGLKNIAKAEERLVDGIDKFVLPNGNEIFLLAEGEMINLAGGKGNPAENMDMGLALQALAIKRIAQDHVELGKGAQPVPHEINQRVATLMLNSIFDY